MPRQLALLLCVLFIAWLFVGNRKYRPMPSMALWIPLIWIVIVGSRPVSLWFGGLQIETTDAYIEGSPLDRTVFLLLIFVGLAVLWGRRRNWGRLVTANKWVFAFFLYCGLSIIWSDYPFVSLKRWIKDLGNVVMVLIILTENDPFQATKSVFFRCACILIPFSVLLIKYFPEYGRYYNRWTWETAYGGVAMNKNTLGCILFVCGIFITWNFIEKQRGVGKRKSMMDIMNQVALLGMILWLMVQAQSSTALVCLFIGSGLLIVLRLPVAQRQVRHLGKYSLAIGIMIILMNVVPGILDAFVYMVGRDITLTGRTDIWANLLTEPIDPLFGAGYQSFWLPAMLEKYKLNQAHNGYLEAYLNGGLVGLCLLMALIVSTGSKLKDEVQCGSNSGIFLLSFLVTALFYNWTEAMFSGLNIIWIILLIAALYPRSLIRMQVWQAERK